MLRGTGGEAGQWDDAGQPGWDRELVALQHHCHPVSQQCWLLPHDGAKHPGISRGLWLHQGLLHLFAVYPQNQSKGAGLVLAPRLQAASEGGLTRASGSPNCFIGGLGPRALRLEGLLWSGGTLGATTSPAACYEGKVFVFTYTSLYLSTGRGQWGKPPESAEWGLCQAALLPPHTPKPSLFQEIGT